MPKLTVEQELKLSGDAAYLLGYVGQIRRDKKLDSFSKQQYDRIYERVININRIVNPTLPIPGDSDA